jgi:nickel transport protein
MIRRVMSVVRRGGWVAVAIALAIVAADAAALPYEVETGPGVSIAVRHADGRVAAREPYVVHAPGVEAPFAEGVTDSRGRVTFLPNQPGEWRVAVTPEQAEPATVTIDVDEAAVMALPHRGLTGFVVASGFFGYLVGLAGILMIWRASRSTYLARSDRGP